MYLRKFTPKPNVMFPVLSVALIRDSIEKAKVYSLSSGLYLVSTLNLLNFGKAEIVF